MSWRLPRTLSAIVIVCAGCIGGAVAQPLEEAVAALASYDVAQRLRAIEILAELPCETSSQALIGALESFNADVASAAARVLGLNGCEAATGALMERTRDWSWKVREAAAWALKDLGAVEAFDAVELLLRDSIRSVRLAALWSISSLDPARARPVLLEFLDSDDHYVREVAVYGLMAIAEETDFAAFTRAAADDSPRVREASAWALAASPGATASTLLHRLASDPNEGVRAAALHSLATAGAPGAHERVLAGLADSSAVVREAAANVLQQTYHQDAGRKLLSTVASLLIEESDDETTDHTTEALPHEEGQDELDDRDIRLLAPVLGGYLEHEEYPVRAEVARLIARLGTREAAVDLARYSSRWDPRDRIVGVLALTGMREPGVGARVGLLLTHHLISLSGLVYLGVFLSMLLVGRHLITVRLDRASDVRWNEPPVLLEDAQTDDEPHEPPQVEPVAGPPPLEALIRREYRQRLGVRRPGE